MKQQGTIKAVSQKSKSYGINIGDQWFNGPGTTDLKRGDEVEVEYEYNETYKSNNIKDVTIVSFAPKEINPAEEIAQRRRILDCVLAVFSQDKNLGQDKTTLKLVAKNLHDVHEEIYKENQSDIKVEKY